MSKDFSFYQPPKRGRLRLKNYVHKVRKSVSRQRIRIGIALSIVCIAGLVFWGWRAYFAPKTQGERKIVYQVENDNPTEDALYGLPKDAVSDVCKRVSAEGIGKAIGEAVRPGRVSIQNATTKEGSVSGCYFQVEGTNPKNVKAVTITSRIFPAESAASDAFKKLSKLDGKRFSLGKAEVIYAEASRQLVLHKGTQLSTIILTQVEADSTLTQDMFTKIADLL